jgi:hypothetical protein
MSYRRKQHKPRNPYITPARMRQSAGPHQIKQKKCKYRRLKPRDLLDEALEELIEEDQDSTDLEELWSSNRENWW